MFLLQESVISWEEIVVQRVCTGCLRVASVYSGFLKRDWLERGRRSGTELRDHFQVFAFAIFCD